MTSLTCCSLCFRIKKCRKVTPLFPFFINAFFDSFSNLDWASHFLENHGVIEHPSNSQAWKESEAPFIQMMLKGYRLVLPAIFIDDFQANRVTHFSSTSLIMSLTNVISVVSKTVTTAHF